MLGFKNTNACQDKKKSHLKYNSLNLKTFLGNGTRTKKKH